MNSLQEELVRIDRGVPEEDQEGSFMNATLQGVGSSLAMSIATTLLVPDHIANDGEEAVAKFVNNALVFAGNTSSRLRFHVQIGPSRSVIKD